MSLSHSIEDRLLWEKKLAEGFGLRVGFLRTEAEVGDELLDVSRYQDHVAVITFSTTVSFECELTVVVGKGSSRRPYRHQPNRAEKPSSA